MKNKTFVDKVYKLTRNAAPLSFMLPTRHSRRFPLLYFDEVQGTNRTLRYARNQKSPFEDEQDGNIVMEPVIFEDGFLRVPKDNPVLQEFLHYHPLNGKKFVEVNEEKDATDEVNQFKIQVPFNEVFLLMILATILFYIITHTAFWSHLKLMGADERAAFTSGVKINWVRIVAHLFAGVFAALSAICFTALVGSGDPIQGTKYTLLGVTALVLGGASLVGGRGGAFGAILGAGNLYLNYSGMDGTGHANQYIAQFATLNGQNLGPGYFAETNDDGEWVPKDLTSLSWGNHDMWLEFETASNLGDDTSGQGHDMTMNAVDSTNQSQDTPTNNFCTLNNNSRNNGNIHSEHGGTYVSTDGGSGWCSMNATMGVSNGKWYWEGTVNGDMDGVIMGVGRTNFNQSLDGENDPGHWYYNTAGYAGYNGSYSSDPAAVTAGQIVQVAFDRDNNKIWFGLKN